MPSDVQVFVRFKEQCVFAGEELKCTITFKNVAEVPETPRTGSMPLHGHAKRASVAYLTSPNLNSSRGGRPQPTRRSPSIQQDENRGRHQASFSLSNPPTPISRNKSPDLSNGAAPMPPSSYRPGHKHQRSVSIISMNSSSLPMSPTTAEAARGNGGHMGHRRSSTVQLAADAVRRPAGPDRQFSTELRVQQRAGRRSPLSASHSPSPSESVSEFKFPAESPMIPKRETLRPSANPEHRRVSHQRAISVASRAESQRTSFDLYAASNHSDETMLSEQVSMVSERPAQRSRMPSELIRQHYRMGPPATRRRQAATLLMGYAQVGASFTLDPSLVEQTPFEEVKKQGFLGGQSGGGVVGVKKKARPSSGLFGGFNFSSLGESLESIMGGDTSSGVKEMKAVTNSRAIPLLSTPQSLLFVDLRLEPGDEKSFTFTYKLPRGLPASYRGKAIKLVYNLTIGIQGSPGAQQQVADVRQVSVPFRVFPGVDTDGEILGHDLMQPHVILKDLATTQPVNDPDHDRLPFLPSSKEIDASTAQFLQFVDNLLDRNRRRQSSSSVMMEPFPTTTGGLVGGDQRQALQAIHRAILSSNTSGSSSSTSTSPNRFEIARGGQRIAVVTLNRPLHRLGETVTAVIDFSQSEIVCASIRATLESAEKVNPSLAVRSAATIARVTRKIYASRAENALFADRVVFSPTIPVLVSPSFITSGVSLEWYVKLEFETVNNDHAASHLEGFDNDTDHKPLFSKRALLEEIVNDEKGVLEVAVESIDCETFEVTIPITVYGDIVNDSSHSMNDAEGIPI